jgi:hypothetical protein
MAGPDPDAERDSHAARSKGKDGGEHEEEEVYGLNTGRNQGEARNEKVTGLRKGCRPVENERLTERTR